MGKTLLARLLMEFFRDSGRPLVGFDLNPGEPLLAGRFPKLVWTVDIADTRGQMALFDRLRSQCRAFRSWIGARLTSSTDLSRRPPRLSGRQYI